MEHVSHVNEKETKEIIDLIKKFVDVWNKKDANEFGQLFSDNAEFTDVVGQVALGKQAIIKMHEYPFSTVQKKAIASFDDLYIREIKPGLVMTNCNWTNTGSQTPKGDPLPPRHGIILILAEKQDGKLKIIFVDNIDLSQPYKEFGHKMPKFIEAN